MTLGGGTIFPFYWYENWASSCWGPAQGSISGHVLWMISSNRWDFEFWVDTVMKGNLGNLEMSWIILHLRKTLVIRGQRLDLFPWPIPLGKSLLLSGGETCEYDEISTPWLCYAQVSLRKLDLITGGGIVHRILKTSWQYLVTLYKHLTSDH